MKRLTRNVLLAIIGVSVLSTSTGCMGSWNLTKKVYNFNDGLTGDKFVDNVVFFVLAAILPVYEITLLLDAIIFNLIEFWSGSNPITMKAGEIETQTVALKGKTYRMTATKNRFKVENITDGEEVNLVFTPKNKSWNLEQEGELTQLVQTIDNGDKLKIFLNGSEEIIANTEYAMNAFRTKMMDTYAVK